VRHQGKAAALALAAGALGVCAGGAAAAEAVSVKRASLESVPISSPEGVARVERLGLDVTHDVSGLRAETAR